ncbi:MAG TPA: phosphoribosyltransferase [bacterium]|nr:phosphoribosyltransferase [bacterium]
MNRRTWSEAPGARLPLADRRQAGRLLAEALGHLRGRTDLVVLALPRGGVPVAVEVALALHATLDVLIVRKLGVPGQEELAMGALAYGGVRVLNEDVVSHLGLRPETIEAAAARELPELERRERAYRGGRPRPELHGRCVVLVDDGLATGSTMEAAIRAVRQLGPARLLVAVPVAPGDTVRRLRRLVDELVCLAEPEPFFSIGQWYRDFAQVDDTTVQALLAEFAHPPGTPPSPDANVH